MFIPEGLSEIFKADFIEIPWAVFDWQTKSVESVHTYLELFDVGNLYCHLLLGLNVPDIYSHKVFAVGVDRPQSRLPPLSYSLSILLFGLFPLLDPSLHPFLRKGSRKFVKADIRSHWESIGDFQEFVSEVEVFLNESDLR